MLLMLWACSACGQGDPWPRAPLVACAAMLGWLAFHLWAQRWLRSLLGSVNTAREEPGTKGGPLVQDGRARFGSPVRFALGVPSASPRLCHPAVPMGRGLCLPWVALRLSVAAVPEAGQCHLPLHLAFRVGWGDSDPESLWFVGSGACRPMFWNPSVAPREPQPLARSRRSRAAGVSEVGLERQRGSLQQGT